MKINVGKPSYRSNDFEQDDELKEIERQLK